MPVPGDYDGDGMPDLAVYFQKGGDWYVRKSADGQILTPEPVNFGGMPFAPVPGNYDGDGATDMAVYHPVYVCDEDLTEGELCNSDHVAAVVKGKNYTSGNHALRMEYIRSRSRSGAADEGVFRVYWDGELVGDWNTWEEELPPAMWKLYVGRLTGGKFRYHQGWYQSVIGE